MDVNDFRKRHLAVAEMIDSWRIIPRIIVAGYSYFLVKMIMWYMDLKPYMLEGCDVEKLGTACLIQAPTTQHAALITAVIGVAAAIFGLYANSGRKWNGFTFWERDIKNSKPEKDDNSF